MKWRHFPASEKKLICAFICGKNGAMEKRTFESIHDLLNRICIEFGWTGNDLAKEAGVAPSTAYRWLRGGSEPLPKLWPALEESLGLDPGTFLEAKRNEQRREYEAKKRTVNPDDVAGYGELTDTDRPLVADLLHEVLERLDEQRQMIEELKRREG